MRILNWGFWKLVVPSVLWLEKRRLTGVFFKPCRDITQILSRSLDEPLGFREKLAVRLHFLYCQWCVSYGNQLHTLRQLARRLGDEGEVELTGEVRLSDEARERIRVKLSGIE